MELLEGSSVTHTDVCYARLLDLAVQKHLQFQKKV